MRSTVQKSGSEKGRNIAWMRTSLVRRNVVACELFHGELERRESLHSVSIPFGSLGAASHAHARVVPAT